MQTALIGYPYIGEQQQWLTIQRSYIAQRISEETLHAQHVEAMVQALQKQKALGISRLTVGDYPILDRMLDLAWMFQLIPNRFAQAANNSLATYFDMAYGHTAEKCTMNNWFATSYCYIEPEFEAQQTLAFRDLYFQAVIEQCQQHLHCTPRVTLIGPMTFLLLTKGVDETNRKAYASMLVSCYKQALQYVAALGVEWVQLEEPSLAYNLTSSDIALMRSIYQQLSSATVHIMLTVPYAMPHHAQLLVDLPVAGVGLDITQCVLPPLEIPTHKVLALGVVQATTVWAGELYMMRKRIDDVQQRYANNMIWLQPSASLMHIPLTKQRETLLDAKLYERLAFADEKIAELVLLAQSSSFTPCTYNVQRSMDEPAYTLQLVQKGIRTKRRNQLQRLFLQLSTHAITTNDGANRGDDTYQMLTAHVVDFPAYSPCEHSALIDYVVERIDGMSCTQHGMVVIAYNELHRPPIQHGAIRWRAPIFLPFVQQLKRSSYMKLVLPGPLSIIKASFLQSDAHYMSIVQQMMRAFQCELQSLAQCNIQMLQLDEMWLYRKLPVKLRAQQRQLKLEMALLQNGLSFIKEVVVVQVRTHVWKANFNELVKSNVIDIVSFNLTERHIRDLYRQLKNIKVTMSLKLSECLAQGQLQLQAVERLYAAVPNRPVWFELDLTAEQLKQCYTQLRQLKKSASGGMNRQIKGY